mgnify:CR=1 FL=1
MKNMQLNFQDNLFFASDWNEVNQFEIDISHCFMTNYNTWREKLGQARVSMVY